MMCDDIRMCFNFALTIMILTLRIVVWLVSIYEQSSFQLPRHENRFETLVLFLTHVITKHKNNL